MIRRAHIDAHRHAVDIADPHATLPGATARLLADTIARCGALSHGRLVALSRPARWSSADFDGALRRAMFSPTKVNLRRWEHFACTRSKTFIANALSREQHG
jgi:hypothetical protein